VCKFRLCASDLVRWYSWYLKLTRPVQVINKVSDIEIKTS